MIQEITYVALVKVLVVSLGLATCSVACLAKDEPALRVGVSSFAANYDESSPIVEQTVETLRKALFPRSVCVTNYSSQDLPLAIQEQQVDLFISCAGIHREQSTHGAHALATAIGPHVTDPSRAEGSVFLVLKEHNRKFQSLRDLKGSVAAATYENSFYGHLMAKREIANAGFDPDDFFKKVHFLGSDQMQIAQAVLNRQADVGIVRTCFLEELSNQFPDLGSRFRVLNEKENAMGEFSCKRSTPLYPNWTLAAISGVDGETLKRVMQAVLAMPATQNGLSWGIGTDFSEVDALLRDLAIGPYAFLREWSLQVFFSRYWKWFVVLAVFVVGLMLHGWRADYLVKRKTAALNDALSREKRLKNESDKAHRELYALQRMGIVSMLSNMFAHELRQPLTTIRVRAYAISRLQEAGDLSMDKLQQNLRFIQEQSQKANDIVENVRLYAKGRNAKIESVNIKEILEKALESFRYTSSRSPDLKITIDNFKDVEIEINPLELELVFFNLVKNAAEAVFGRKNSEIVISNSVANEKVTVTISDNGKMLTDEEFSRLQSVVHTTKPQGTGLGLPLIRSLLEAHGHRLILSRRPQGGLTARVILVRTP